MAILVCLRHLLKSGGCIETVGEQGAVRRNAIKTHFFRRIQSVSKSHAFPCIVPCFAGTDRFHRTKQRRSLVFRLRESIRSVCCTIYGIVGSRERLLIKSSFIACFRISKILFLHQAEWTVKIRSHQVGGATGDTLHLYLLHRPSEAVVIANVRNAPGIVARGGGSVQIMMFRHVIAATGEGQVILSPQGNGEQGQQQGCQQIIDIVFFHGRLLI